MTLKTEKSRELCKEIVKIMRKQFPQTFNLDVDKLMSDNFIIHYLSDECFLKYIGISKIMELNGGSKSVVLCYSYVNEHFRNQGIGKSAIVERIKYIHQHYPELPITASCRIKNIPSMKIFKKVGFTACFNFMYHNGDQGVKFVLC